MPEMVIENRPIAALKPSPRNARTHSDTQVEQIVRSVREFGWTSPLLIDGSGEVIAGHGRLLAARQLGMKEVPCIILDTLSEAQKRALRLADNKIALNSGWDQELLQHELRELSELEFDLSLMGFPDDEFKPETSAAEIRSIMTGTVDDQFWISVSGPLPMQADALEGLKSVMARFPGIKVELGTVARDGHADI